MKARAQTCLSVYTTFANKKRIRRAADLSNKSMTQFAIDLIMEEVEMIEQEEKQNGTLYVD
jgi:uncharacterized protein (DUF1778 family)